MQVNLELLKKYDRPGPRYTSYPTAPHFHEGFGSQEYRQQILEHNALGNGLSIYVHLPFCASMCYYCACNVVITRRPERIDAYLDYLSREMDLVRDVIDPERQVRQVHWGGGTPNYLTHTQMERLFAMVRKRFAVVDDSENGIEIDPRHLEPGTLQVLRDIGFNRLSFGAQDFDERVQEAVHRVQPYELTKQTCEEARRLGFESVNIDMIYGLPYQTLESYTQSIRQLIGIRPDRIAVFNYAHVPWLKKHQVLISGDALPKPETKLAILQMVIEELTSSGYVAIGMDHFALPEDELAVALRERQLHRNFQGYSTRSGLDVHAFGTTGISQLHGAYAQNAKDLKSYYAALDAGEFPIHRGYQLSEDDQVRRKVISELMCNGWVDMQAIEQEFGIDFGSYFADALESLQEMVTDDLLCLDEKRIEVLPMGQLLIRNLAMPFDHYLKSETKRAYSRTV